MQKQDIVNIELVHFAPEAALPRIRGVYATFNFQ